MSGRSRTVSIEILADGKGADKAFSEVGKSADGLGGKLGKVAKVGGLAIAGIGIAAGAVAIDAGRAFIGFQNQMNEVFTLLPGISQDAMDDMTGQVLDFSKEFGALPDEVVPALYQSLSAGVPPDNVFAFLEVAQKAAIGGVTELQTAVDGISSVVNAYGSDVLGAAEASDLMFTAVRLGKTDFEQLSSSLFNVIPTASSLGVQFGDVTAALATITAQGTPTSVATTQIRAAMVEATKAGGDLDTAIRDLTGEGFTDLIASGSDMGSIFQALRESMPEEEFRGLFGSVESMNAVLGITGSNAETFATNLDAMGDSAGATEGAFEQMDSGVQRNIDKIKANLAAMRLELGSRLLPAAVALSTAILDKAVPALDALQSFVGDTVIPAITPFVQQVGNIINLLSSGDFSSAFDNAIGLLGDLGGVAAGIASSLLDAVVGIDYTNIATSIWNGILSGFGALTDAGVRFGNWFIGAVTGIDYSGIASSVWNGIISGLSALGDAATSAGAWLLGLFTSVDWSGTAQSILDGLIAGFNAVQDFGQRVVDWISGQVGGADWGSINDAITTGLGAALDTLNSLGENEGVQSFIALIEDRLSPVLDVLANEILPILQPTIDNLKESFDEIAATVRERAGPMLDQLKETGQALAPILETLGKIVGGVLLVALIGLGEYLSRVLPPAVEIALDVIEGMLIVIETLATTVQNMVDLVTALIEGDWSAAWEAAQALVNDFVGGMIEAVTPLVGTISGIFNDLMGAVLGILGDLGVWMLTEGGPMLVASLADGLAWLVSEAPGGAFHLWVNLNTRIVEMLYSLGDWLLTEGGPQLVSNIVSGLANLFSQDNVVGALGQFMKLSEMVNTQILALGTWLVTEGAPALVSKLIEGLQDLFSVDTAVGVVGQFIKLNDELGSRVETIATSALGWGFDVASNFVSGMIDMLTSSETWSNLYNSAFDLAGNMLQGAWDAIKPGSPSLEGRLIGQSFYQGIGWGLQDGEPEVYQWGWNLGETAAEGSQDGWKGYDGEKWWDGRWMPDDPEQVKKEYYDWGWDLGSYAADGSQEAWESPDYGWGWWNGEYIVPNPAHTGSTFGNWGTDLGKEAAEGSQDAWEGYGLSWWNGTWIAPPSAYEGAYDWGWGLGGAGAEGAQDGWENAPGVGWWNGETILPDPATAESRWADWGWGLGQSGAEGAQQGFEDNFDPLAWWDGEYTLPDGSTGNFFTGEITPPGGTSEPAPSSTETESEPSSGPGGTVGVLDTPNVGPGGAQGLALPAGLGLSNAQTSDLLHITQILGRDFVYQFLLSGLSESPPKSVSTMIRQLQSLASSPASGTLQPSGSGFGSGTGGSNPINLSVNLGNSRLIDEMLDTVVPGLSLSVSG